MLFFTSDTHFNDSKIIYQYGRAFSDGNYDCRGNSHSLYSLKYIIHYSIVF